MLNLITDNLDVWASAELPAKSGGRGRAASNGKSPHGIQKLRELILELAVRGKLVPQDTDWKSSKLGKLGRWAVGSGFPTAEQGLSGLEILFVKVSDMNLPENTKFILTSNHTISRETAVRLRVNIHPEGTVVFPKIGGAIATNKRRILSVPTAIDNNCLGIVPRDGVYTEWLYTLLASIDFTQYQAGTSVPALAQGVLEEIDVLLPPLAEQHRIVAKVDELMALCDQLEQEQTDNSNAHQTLVETLLATLTQAEGGGDFAAAWQRIAAHFDTLFTTEQSIDQLKQTILQLAVMGKLVLQNPNDELVSELLKKIAAEKSRLVKEKKIKKQEPLAEIGDVGLAFSVPPSWKWCHLSDLLALVTDGDHQAPPKSEFGVPFLVIGNLNTGILDFDGCNYVSDDYYQNLDWVRQPAEGDLLYTVTGSFGIPIPVQTKQHFCVQRHVAILKSVDSTPRKYLSLLLASKHAFTYASSIATGIAQKTVPLTGLRKMPIPVPPLAEQRRIVAKVDELMSLCDALKTRLNEARLTQVQLADAIVEQAVA